MCMLGVLRRVDAPKRAMTAALSTFADNTVGQRGGAMFLNRTTTTPNITGCTFTNNRAGDSEKGMGGAISAYYMNGLLVVSTGFWVRDMCMG